MASPGFAISGTPVVIVPDNVTVSQTNQPVISGSYGQPPGVTVLQIPASVIQHDRGAPNSPNASIGFNNPPTMLQNLPGMSNLSNAPTMIQNPSVMIQDPAGTVDSQNPPVTALNMTGTTTLQNSLTVSQNPTILNPGPTPNVNQPYWSLSFGNFTTFDIKKFIDEEVKTLGVVQIMTGLMHIFLGAVLFFKGSTVLFNSGYPFWGGLCFIVSGSLSILAAKEPVVCMVKGSVGMNIVSAIFSIVGILILIFELILGRNWGIETYITGVLMVFSFLESLITCIACHFGCQATGWNQNWSTMTLTNMFNTRSTMASVPQQGFTSARECPQPRS